MGAMIGFETERLRIEAAAVRHASLLPPFFARNRAHFAPWDPPRPAGIEATEYWQRQLEQAEAEFDEARAARFVVFERAAVAPMLIGRVNFTQIFRGPFQSCVLGYQIDHAFEGQGLMHEALGTCIAFMFRDFRLHRIQAGFRPENERSARLLTRLGFQRIGIARDYLFIDHAWRDHVLMALVNPDFDDSAVAEPRR